MALQSSQLEDLNFVRAIGEVLTRNGSRFDPVELSSLLDKIDGFLRLSGKSTELTSSAVDTYLNVRTQLAWRVAGYRQASFLVDLLRNSIGTLLQLTDLDPREICYQVLAGVLSLDERDRVKQSLRQAMLENNESFRPTAISSTTQLPQTIGGWLKHYNVYVNGKIGTSLQRAQYLTQVVGSNLSEEQKKQLKILIQAFDYLKLSSVNLESDTEVMSVDVGGTPMVWRAGELEEVIPPKDVIESLEKMGFLKPEPSESVAFPPLGTIAPPIIPSAKVVPESQKTVPLATVPSAIKPLAVPLSPPIAAKPPLSAPVSSQPASKILPPSPSAPVAPPPPLKSSPPPAVPPKQPPMILPQLLTKELPSPSVKQISPLPRAISGEPLKPPLSPVGVIADNVDELAKKVMREISVPNLDVQSKERLESAIRLRLREVRDTVDTRDALLKKRAEGGLELSDQIVDEVIGVIMKYLPEAHRPFSAAVAAADEIVSASKLPSDLLSADLAKQEKTSVPIKPSSPPPIPKIIIAEKEIAPEPLSAVKPDVAANVKSAIPLSPLPKPPVMAPAAPIIPRQEVPFPKSTPPTPAPARKPAMIDVHSKPSAVGPIDELRLFTVADFRRLDTDPKRATSRLKEKIKLLEEESYARMVEGVRAWRVSPLNQIYLAIGHESLQGQKSVTDAIRDRREAGKATLTEEEFQALLDLNKQLRF